MSGKQEFIEFVDGMYNEWVSHNYGEMSENAMKYFENLKIQKPEKEKPLFTDNGKLILKYMREHNDNNPYFTSKEIAEGIEITSRAVSGAIRKLVTDGYVVKVGEEPIQYAVTDKGTTIEII